METDNSIYNKSIHIVLDELQTKIDSTQHFMGYLIKSLENYIDDKVYFKKSKEDNDLKSLITLKYNDRDGHYLLITNRRCDILKKNLEKIKSFQVGAFELNVNDLEFVELPKSSNTKINCKKFKEMSIELVNYKILMAKKIKELFKIDMEYVFKNFGNLLHIWSKKIGYIDFINSGALCAVNNHYTKPTIVSKKASFFKAKELRHPILEKINTQTTFVPHDIELGFETVQNGILLYGINSSGKSTLMKSIGLNVVLAQIGYYTATSNFEYCPYSSLFTRICGNDNMYRGQSSFMVEMMELMTILKRNSSSTLMIGDELCRGTEITSSNVIVCYMLEKLGNSGTSFITATHLHEIVNMNAVKQLKSISIKHLKITYDPENDLLIYDRSLSDGQGDSFYGLQIAKYLMKDKTFNERTAEILKEYNNNSVDKTSKYNSNVYLNNCEICKSTKNLETHHIIWQKEFKNGINKNQLYIKKDDPSNLVVLCMSCHDDVDRNKIIINGWIDTSGGRKFDYEICNNVSTKKSKYSEEILDYIMKLQNSVNNDAKMARIKIKEKFDKKISTKTINKIWNNLTME
jgi:DNA mismatch repair protein MutS